MTDDLALSCPPPNDLAPLLSQQDRANGADARQAGNSNKDEGSASFEVAMRSAAPAA